MRESDELKRRELSWRGYDDTLEEKWLQSLDETCAISSEPTHWTHENGVGSS